MNDWRPNWLDPSEYPPENASFSRFAWEFLRRNSHYQDQFSYFGGRRISNDFFLIGVDDIPDEDLERFYKVRSQYGMLCYMVDPVQNYEVVDGYLRFSSSVSFLGNKLPTRKENNYEIFARLDLRFSPAQQAKAIQRMLELRRKRQSIKSIKPEKKPLIDLLRILDANFSEVSKELIAKELYPSHPNEYPDRIGNKYVRDRLKLANDLTGNHFYQLVVATQDEIKRNTEKKLKQTSK